LRGHTSKRKEGDRGRGGNKEEWERERKGKREKGRGRKRSIKPLPEQKFWSGKNRQTAIVNTECCRKNPGSIATKI